MVSRFIRNCKTPLKCCIFALLLATQESSTCSESSLKVKVLVSHVQLFTTPWTVAHQALCPWGFSRQEYWSGLPFPSPGDLPKPGIEPASPAVAGGFFTTEPPGKPHRVRREKGKDLCTENG